MRPDEKEDAELRRRLAVYKGKRQKSPDDRPKPGEGKSTKIHLWDIALLSRIDRSNLRRFLRGTWKFKPLTKARLSSTLTAVEQGLVTKSQFGVYHFHDEPQHPPSIVMQIDMKTGRIIRDVKQNTTATLPNFKKLFGGD